MRDDDNNPRWPSWKEADGTGKFFYIVLAVWVFLILASLLGW